MDKSVTKITLLAAGVAAALTLGGMPTVDAQEVEREAEEIERNAQREAREAERATRREAREARREAREEGREAGEVGRTDDTQDTQVARAGNAAGMAHPPVQSLDVERGDQGAYLVDGRGYALYLLEEDDGGESRCYEQCAEQWPPAMVDGRPTVDNRRIDEDELGTIERTDGRMQLTYDDHPLYYYYRDSAPGQVTGHDIHDEWGGWYLVTPDGDKLEQGGD